MPKIIGRHQQLFQQINVKSDMLTSLKKVKCKANDGAVLASPIIRFGTAASLLVLSMSAMAAQEVASISQVDLSSKTTRQANATPSTKLDTIVVKAKASGIARDSDVSQDNDTYNANVATVGSKTPEYLENIPQSVSVVTRAKIDDVNAVTLDQVAKRTPAIRVLKTSDGRSSIFSRGYEFDRFSVDGLAAPISSIGGTQPNLAAFERVEIQRGASGLFDSGADMAGVINLVRKRGQVGADQQLKASISNPKGAEVVADLQGGISRDDSLVGRAVVQLQQQKNPVVSDITGSDDKNGSLYLSLDKTLNENSKVGVGYLLQKRNLSPNNGLPTLADGTLLNLPNRDFYGSKWNGFANQTQDVFADFEHQLDNEGVINAGVRYSKREADFNYTFAGSPLANGKTNVAGIGSEFAETALSADINLTQPFYLGDKQSKYVIGADFKRFDTDNATARSLAIAKDLTAEQINNLPFVDVLEQGRQQQKGYRLTHSDNRLNEAGLYAKVNYQPIDKLNLIAGGRLSSYKVDSQDKVTNVSASLGTNHKATGYGALVYELTPNINAYGSFSQVFTPQFVNDKNGNILKPREGEQFEIGLKAHLNDQLSGSLSSYRLVDTNAAAPTVAGDQVALGKRQMQGVELEVNGEVLPNLQITGGYSYLDSDIKHASSPQNDGVFLLLPKHSGNLWVNYQAENWLPNPLSLGLGVNAVGKYTSAQGVQAKAYQTWEAMVSYPFSPQLTGQLNVYNLFDNDYYERIGTNNTFNLAGEGREIKAALSYKF